jgi:tetraacyldisaccharide 4'-kinase
MTFALAPFSVLYGAVTRARLALYCAGALSIHRLGVPVISVGNITAGGTGKTPLVEWLARAAAREGRRVCVLTRGYGRQEARRRVVVSDGARLLADAQAGGDEPRLLAENLLGSAAVVSDADRVAAARWARDALDSNVFILDDGFQHLRVARDLNVVTLDASAPWGGGHLLPRGRLREPPRALARADCIVITRAELAPDLAKLRAQVARLSRGRPIFNARTRTRRIRPLAAHAAASSLAPDELTRSLAPEELPRPLFAFCALGNAQAFFTHARNAGCELSGTRHFADHHAYTQTDVAALASAAAQTGASALVTTAKDAVKLHALRVPLPCYVFEIEPVLDEAEELLTLLRAALAAKA